MKEVDNSMIYGEMPPRIEALAKGALKMEAPGVQKKSFAFALLVATLILALACTALAMGLNRSAKAAAVKAAREAVMEKYGITTETMGIFEVYVRLEDGVWTVSFDPIKFGYRTVGRYTVTIADGQAPAAEWMHDDVSPETYASGLLSDPVWGQAQIEKALALEKEYKEYYAAIDWESTGEWSLADWAQMDSLLAEASDMGMNIYVMHVLPQPEDLKEAEAVALAKEAVSAQYGLTPEALARYSVQARLLQYLGYTEREYQITLRLAHEDGGLDEFHITIHSVSERIGACYWVVNPEYRTLPGGPLWNYQTAVREFIEEGAFEALGHEARAELGARILEAGFGRYIDRREYAAPSEGAVAEAEAVAAAQTAMLEAYPFTEETLALFERSVSCILVNGEPVWAVDYAPALPEFYWWPFEKAMGTYEVLVSADTGAAVEVSWSLEAARGEEEYTQSNWGQAPAVDAEMLPWAAALMNAVMRNMEQYPFDRPRPVEAEAAMDQLFRDAGYDATQYPNALPGEGEISEEEALAIARQAIYEEFPLEKGALEAGAQATQFLIDNPEYNAWVCWFFPYEGRQDTFTVWIDATGDKVLYVDYTAVGNG